MAIQKFSCNICKSNIRTASSRSIGYRLHDHHAICVPCFKKRGFGKLTTSFICCPVDFCAHQVNLSKLNGDFSVKNFSSNNVGASTESIVSELSSKEKIKLSAGKHEPIKCESTSNKQSQRKRKMTFIKSRLFDDEYESANIVKEFYEDLERLRDLKKDPKRHVREKNAMRRLKNFDDGPLVQMNNQKLSKNSTQIEKQKSPIKKTSLNKVITRLDFLFESPNKIKNQSEVKNDIQSPLWLQDLSLNEKSKNLKNSPDAEKSTAKRKSSGKLQQRTLENLGNSKIKSAIIKFRGYDIR